MLCSVAFKKDSLEISKYNKQNPFSLYFFSNSSQAKL